MTFEKKENGSRYIMMPDWSLTLTPIKTPDYSAFSADYYEKGEKLLSFIVSSDYESISGVQSVFDNTDIMYKVHTFLKIFKQMDELELSF